MLCCYLHKMTVTLVCCCVPVVVLSGPCFTALFLLCVPVACRQSPRVDPLYMAPLSPRRSNSATPRSSPARSPAALVPMPPASLNVVRSPAGVAPASASAALPAARSSRQSLSFSAGSKGAPRADPQREEQQQHKLATGAGRRACSAPPSPASAAPRGTVRAPSVGGASSSGTSSRPGSTRSSQGVSHQSLYCQKLAYSSVRGTVAPGVRKTDRVARFQQLQQQWARDRYVPASWLLLHWCVDTCSTC
jgi:hypothetical protein